MKEKKMLIVKIHFRLIKKKLACGSFMLIIFTLDKKNLHIMNPKNLPSFSVMGEKNLGSKLNSFFFF